MKDVFWYQPNESYTFSGFVSHHQSNIEDVLEYHLSSLFSSVHPASRAFDYSNDVTPAATKSNADNYLSFSFIDHYFYITHYEIQQIGDQVGDFMEEWKFEGSNDGSNWDLLGTGKADSSFNMIRARKLNECKKGLYQYFKLTEVGQVRLVIQGIEVYGVYCENSWTCKQLFSGLHSVRYFAFSHMVFFAYVFIL